MKNKFLVFLLPLVLFLAGCPKDAYRASAQAADGVAQSVHSGIAVVQQLNADGVLGDEEAVNIAVVLIDINEANAMFIEAAKTIHKAGGGKAEYLVAARSVSVAVAGLNEAGVLHIKNAEAKARVQAVIVSIQASVDILIAAIEGAK